MELANKRKENIKIWNVYNEKANNIYYQAKL